MKTVSTFQIIYRAFVIAVGVYLCLVWFVDTVQKEDVSPLIHALFFWLGAWFWESIMFFVNKVIKER
jgi:hypothetical protein